MFSVVFGINFKHMETKLGWFQILSVHYKELFHKTSFDKANFIISRNKPDKLNAYLPENVSEIFINCCREMIISRTIVLLTFSFVVRYLLKREIYHFGRNESFDPCNIIQKQ